MRFLLGIYLLFPLLALPVEVIDDPYADLIPGTIDAYHYDIPEPDIPNWDCYCPSY